MGPHHGEEEPETRRENTRTESFVVLYRLGDSINSMRMFGGSGRLIRREASMVGRPGSGISRQADFARWSSPASPSPRA